MNGNHDDTKNREELLHNLLKAEGFNVSESPVIIRKVPEKDSIPLTFSQERLWFLGQLEPDQVFYNMSVCLCIKGSLHIGALREALNEISRRHEILRTRFQVAEKNPVQVIENNVTVELPLLDFREHEKETRDLLVYEHASAEFHTPFDLSRGPLLRTKLIHFDDNEYRFILTKHHIISDGWSVGILIDELSQLYNAFSTNKPSPLPPLSIQYSDYTLWQREYFKSVVLKEDLPYWKKQLDGLSHLRLPVDHPRPSIQSFEGKHLRFVIPEKLAGDLRDLGKKEDATLFILLLAAFKVLLFRYTGQNDIAIGIPIANRNRVEIEKLIGFFVNNLVIRAKFSGNDSFRIFLKNIRKTALEAFTHQDMPFEKLVNELETQRDLSYSPLFQVMFSLENTPKSHFQFGNLEVDTLPVDDQISRFDLTLLLEEVSGTISGWWEYSTRLFEETTITQMMNHYINILENIVINPDACLSGLDLLSESEKHQMLVDWEKTGAPHSNNRSILDLFEEQVKRNPDMIALIDSESHAHAQITYGELDRRANQVGWSLRKRGVGAEVVVGICLTRSIEMIIGMLGVFKAGGAYLPLDPEYPGERLGFMLKDAKVTVLLTQTKLAERFTDQEAEVIFLDQDPPFAGTEPDRKPDCQISNNHLAYVIYTSGSTGQPKGVLVPHQGLLNLVWWHIREFQVTPADRATQLAGPGFDASVWEIWPYLISGARLYLVEPGKVTAPEELRDWMAEEGITISFVPTPLAEEMLRLEWPQKIGLRIMLTGGDRLKTYAPEGIPFKLINNYGPTENSVVATSGEVTAKPEGNPGGPHIGRPIDNTGVYILDSYLNPVPAGVAGEIYIAGKSLARGYLNRPELTAEKFIPNPFNSLQFTVDSVQLKDNYKNNFQLSTLNSQLYKTGDWARYLRDGNIEFLGRIDDQVKVRGFRIELGEIETVLRTHRSVKDAVVIPGKPKAATSGWPLM